MTNYTILYYVIIITTLFMYENIKIISFFNKLTRVSEFINN